MLEIGYSCSYSPDIATTLYTGKLIREDGTVLTIPDGYAMDLSALDGLPVKLIVGTLMVSGFDGYDFGGAVYGINAPLGTQGFNDPKIKIFPNPARNAVCISRESTITHIMLYNTQGACIATFTPGNIIDLSGISAGFYVIIITDSTGRSSTEKLVISK